MKIVVVLWTRPELIKCWSIIKECEKKGILVQVIHSWQHYDNNMNLNFTNDLDIKIDKQIQLNQSSRPWRLIEMFKYIMNTLICMQPDVVLVQWDTDTARIWAECGNILWIKVWHIEAWLRSNDRDMPEEINRIIIDHIADYLFSPTRIGTNNLIKEWINTQKIIETWNTIVDIVQNIDKNIILEDNFVFMTLHRVANVDNEKQLRDIIKQVNQLKTKVFFTIHPRTKKMLRQFRIILPKNIIELPPLRYTQTLWFIHWANYIITDSWWIQEESYILWKPCIVVRDNTERPNKNSILRDHDLEKAKKKAMSILNLDYLWEFWDCKSAEKILNYILDNYKN